MTQLEYLFFIVVLKLFYRSVSLLASAPTAIAIFFVSAGCSRLSISQVRFAFDQDQLSYSLAPR
jgi:hypothetical protein